MTAGLVKTSNGTIPLADANTDQEFLTYFRFNLSRFPHERYRGWLDFQKPILQRVARQFPPTKVYRVRDDGRLCAIAGYKSDGDSFIRVACVVLGEEMPQFLDPAQLQDATAELATLDNSGAPPTPGALT